ncbi:MAG: helix-turn-helix domain-containing protein [Phycisphaeraceae bacterium]|nr:helix-turn-helix domain-containing protein [Phycisphaeraceae bacterium]
MSYLGTKRRQLVTAQCAREYLGLTKHMWKEVIRHGRLPYVLVGRAKLFEVKDLDAFVDRKEIAARPGIAERSMESLASG